MATRLVGRHSYAARGFDLYETPLIAVEALLASERLPHRIWEPACGRGAIVLPLRAAGHEVIATDLVHRGCPDSTGSLDFTLWWENPPSAEAIVTNPPFKLAKRFCELALHRAPFIAMLLPLTFLEGQNRRDWFEHTPLARVHVFSRRLPMMHRDGWDGPRNTSTKCFAWFVWDRGWQGEPVIRWL